LGNIEFAAKFGHANFFLQTSLFARLISHQPAVLFSQNEPATSNQPQPASNTLLSEQTSTSHQPPPNRTDCFYHYLVWYQIMPSSPIYSTNILAFFFCPTFNFPKI
jgi:hypothetical protein